MKITIIVSVCNSDSGLDRCTQSIMNQSNRNLEILLFCTSTRSEVLRPCEGYASQDKRIRFANLPNASQAEIWNYGLDMIQGQYVLFIDSMDCLAPNEFDSICDIIGSSMPDMAIFEASGLRKGEASLDGKALTEAYVKGLTSFDLRGKIIRSDLFNGLRFKDMFRYAEQTMVTELLENCKEAIMSSNRILISRLNENDCIYDYVCNGDLNLLRTWESLQAFIDSYYPDLTEQGALYVVRGVFEQIFRIYDSDSCVAACIGFYEALLDVLRKELRMIRKEQMNGILKMKTDFLLKHPQLFDILYGIGISARHRIRHCLHNSRTKEYIMEA